MHGNPTGKKRRLPIRLFLPITAAARREHRNAAGAVELGEYGVHKDSSELLVVDGTVSDSISCGREEERKAEEGLTGEGLHVGGERLTDQRRSRGDRWVAGKH